MLPQRGGAADAGSCGAVPPPEQRHRARVAGSSSGGGLSQKQQRAKSTATVKGALLGEEVTPQKHRPRGNRSEHNPESSRSRLLDISEYAHTAPSIDASHRGTAAKESAAKHCANKKQGMSSVPKISHGGKTVVSRGKIEAKEEKVCQASGGEMPQKQQAKQEMNESSSRLRRHPEKLAKSKESATKHCAKEKAGVSRVVPKHGAKEVFSSGKLLASSKDVAPKKLLKDSSGGEKPQKHQAKQETVRGAVDTEIREEPPNSSSKSHTQVDLSLEDTDLQEADDEIQKLNRLGLGEEISPDEFLKYFDQLPDEPSIDLYTKLDDELLTPLYERHALYRLRYLKLSQNASKDKLDAELKEHNALDLLEKDFSGELLSKMWYFEHFERDGSLDWFFDPDLCRIQALDDYQRLVLRNHGVFEYEDLDQYRKWFHSYETGQEYLDYCKELSKKLKWMEDYLQIESSSLKWEKISTRGAFQAIKIATGFLKITGDLAYIGYYECLNNMSFRAFWLEDLDDVYFEIWLRVTKQKKSFRNALEEVYRLDKFPSRQHRMKYALEYENLYSDMEMEFCTCTTGVTSDVTEDEAHKLIAEGIKKIEKPTLYEHYVRRKIAIAQSIGLIAKVQQPSARSGQQVEV